MRKWGAAMRNQESNHAGPGEGVDMEAEGERGDQASGSGNWGSGQVAK